MSTFGGYFTVWVFLCTYARGVPILGDGEPCLEALGGPPANAGGASI